MKSIKIKARAKINLSLDIKGRYNDGYHRLSMVLHSVDVYDGITVNTVESGISLNGSHNNIPWDDRNIGWKAARLMMDEFGERTGINIYIDKSIPAEAGMAGGSADGAAVMLGIKELWNLDISLDKLAELSSHLGMDVPFCMLGGCTHAMGKGDQLKHIRSFDGVNIVIAVPSSGASTPLVYKTLDFKGRGNENSSLKVVDAIKHKDIHMLAESISNGLYDAAVTINPQIGVVRNDILSTDVLGVSMTGSGSAVYGIYEDKSAADKAEKFLRSKYTKVYNTIMSAKGLEIIRV